MNLNFLSRLSFPIIFLSILGFTGVSILVLGMLSGEFIYFIPCALIAIYLHRSLFRFKPLAILVITIATGTLFGTFLGEFTKFVFGIFSGTLWGAFVGFALIIPLSMLMPGVGIGSIKIVIVPNVPIVQKIFRIIAGLAMSLGGIWGLLYLRVAIAEVYGALSSGIILGWIIGIIIIYKWGLNVPRESRDTSNPSAVQESKIKESDRKLPAGRILCPNCGIEIWEGSEKCWKCSTSLSKEKNN